MPVVPIQFQVGISFVPSVYLDANFIVYAKDRLSPKYISASTLLAELITNNINMFITNLVVDEYIWALLRAKYRQDHCVTLTPRIVKSTPGIIATYHGRISSDIRTLLSLPRLTVASDLVPSRGIVDEAINLMNSELLMPRDAFHLAFITKLNIEGLITSDRDFDNLSLPGKNLTIYKY